MPPAGLRPEVTAASRHLRPVAMAAATALLGAVLLPSSAGADERAIELTGEELVANPTFDEGASGWWATPNLLGEDADDDALEDAVLDGALCVEVPGDTSQPWDVIVGQDDLPVVEGQDYVFTFTASGSLPRVSRSMVQMPRDPWTAYLTVGPTLGDEPQTYVDGFTAPETRDDAQIVFQVGGSAEPWTFCLHDVSLVPGTIEAYRPATGPRVRVNQVGYLPAGPKHATLVTDAHAPLEWQLLASDDRIVAEGVTVPRGHDPTAGVDVHTIDLGDVRTPGEGYTLVADGDRSYPFTIGAHLYEELVLDAMSFFYPQRSGIEILGEVAGEEYARPAGHVSAPDGSDDRNQGDLQVPCLPEDEAIAQYGRATMSHYGDAWPCDYTLDVVGGWYDAGDHGKYVVNGGISVFTLLSAYERAHAAPTGDPEGLADGTLRIPEAGNGVPDVLDEARWQLEFLLRMQVPDGAPFAGMAHHKIHDLRWTGLPLFPHEGTLPRYLHPPTTAASLNLAAAAAQGARVWRAYDPAFADDLLAAARRAWDAAEAHPELLAPPPSHDNPGGGPYDDTDVTDEFYWAASQLYLTTGEDRYLEAVLDNPRHDAAALQVFRGSGAFDWRSTAGAARLSLASMDSDLPDRDRIQRSVLEGAEAYLQTASEQPFGHAYAPASDRYEWGSNHLLVNNLIVIATAYDLTGDQRYLDGVLEGLDYLFGRNALNLSYVTGWGEVAVENQHSRWYANQLNPETPNPPPGSLAGGPNSQIQDPVAGRLLRGCPAQMCFVDDIESWSTNEITINWNGSLSWLAAFVADQGDGGAVGSEADADAVGPQQGSAEPDAAADVPDATGAAAGWPWAVLALLGAVVGLGVVLHRRRASAAPAT